MKRKVLSSLFPLVFWLFLWEAAARLVWHTAELGGELLLPSPGQVLAALWELCRAPLFWQTALLSLGRILLGVLLGSLAGTLLAWLTAFHPRWRNLLSPVIKTVRAAPVASFILLLLLWVQRDAVPTVIAALMVLPVVWSGVEQGIAGADPQLLELARCYRFSRGKTLLLCRLPALLPPFSASLATAMGLAWKAGVAAEVLCQPKFAIGTQIYRTKTLFSTPQLFAWTLVVILLSLLMERGMGRLLKGRWKG